MRHARSYREIGAFATRASAEGQRSSRSPRPRDRSLALERATLLCSALDSSKEYLKNKQMPPARTPRSTGGRSPKTAIVEGTNKPSKAMVTRTWVENAALAQDSKGTWVAARSVHGWKSGDPPFRITFTADMTTDEQHQQPTPRQRGRVVSIS